MAISALLLARALRGAARWGVAALVLVLPALAGLARPLVNRLQTAASPCAEWGLFPPGAALPDPAFHAVLSGMTGGFAPLPVATGFALAGRATGRHRAGWALAAPCLAAGVLAPPLSPLVAVALAGAAPLALAGLALPFRAHGLPYLATGALATLALLLPGLAQLAAAAPIDRAYHDTYYVIGTSSYAAVGYLVFLAFFGLAHAVGRSAGARFAWAHGAALALSVAATALPQALLARQAMPRRTLDPPEAFATANPISAIAGQVTFLLLLAWLAWRAVAAAPTARNR